MKPTAIVYKSATGHTEQYARMLGEATGLPVYSLDEAKQALAQGTEIVYLGWLMASRIRGFRVARRYFRVCAVCGVGIGENGSQLSEVRRSNILPDDLPVFILQGGFDKTKLRGLSRFVMGVISQSLADKKQRTPQEEQMLQTLTGDLNFVSKENLTDVLSWYAETEK